MTTQPELFTFGRRTIAPRYPEVPGHQRTDTSRAAAESITDHAGTLRGMVLDALKVRPMTADECADFLMCSPLSIRPRLTELKRRGLIRDTGTRRNNHSGKSAAVMEAKR